MAGKTSKNAAKVATKAAATRAGAKAAKPPTTAPKSLSRKLTKPALLAGGNPQIAKADGDAPVQAYVAAMPGWKRDVGRRLDALIVRTVPGVVQVTPIAIRAITQKLNRSTEVAPASTHLGTLEGRYEPTLKARGR